MRTLLIVTMLALASPTVAAEGPLEHETREILDAMLRIDTSHGGETAVLKPLLQRFASAGIPAELIESAPGRGNLIARIAGGGQSKKKPLLLLAHVDVVPVESQNWTSPAFVPTEKDGYLVARGVGDDKGMAAAFVAIALQLKRQKTPLSRDLIVALTADEETSGAYGVKWLLSQPKAKALGLTSAAIALNEGGWTALDQAEKQIIWMGIGVAEKTFQSYELEVKGHGGHSSIPNANANPVTNLARALTKLGEYRFAGHVIPATRDSLKFRAKFESPLVSEAIERTLRTGKTSAADDKLFADAPAIDALLRTTCVATMLLAAAQDNVLPTRVVATVNCRVMPDESREGTAATLKRIIGDESVAITPLTGMGDGGASPVDGEVPTAFRSVVGRLFPKAAQFPMMGTGASDSRYLRTLGIAAYGIGVWPISQEDGLAGHGAHGADERRPLRWFGDGLRFAYELVNELVKK